MLDMSRRLCCRMEKNRKKCNRGVLRVNRLVLNGDSHMLERTNSLDDMDYLCF